MKEIFSAATIENNPGSLLLEDTEPTADLKGPIEHKFHKDDIVIRNSVDATPR